MSEGPILVTGGLGYVGGRLIPALRRAAPGRKIRVLTRGSAAARPAWAGDLQVHQADLLASPDLSDALRGVEMIIHLAGPDQQRSREDPVEAAAARVGGTARLLEAARRARVRRLLYLSTIHVYGPLDAGPITEDTLPRPMNPYAITHLAAEHFVLAEAQKGAVGGLVFRLSNGYGCPADAPTDRWPSYAFLIFCRQAARSGVI